MAFVNLFVLDHRLRQVTEEAQTEQGLLEQEEAEHKQLQNQLADIQSEHLEFARSRESETLELQRKFKEKELCYPHILPDAESQRAPVEAPALSRGALGAPCGDPHRPFHLFPEANYQTQLEEWIMAGAPSTDSSRKRKERDCGAFTLGSSELEIPSFDMPAFLSFLEQEDDISLGDLKDTSCSFGIKSTKRSVNDSPGKAGENEEEEEVEGPYAANLEAAIQHWEGMKASAIARREALIACKDENCANVQAAFEELIFEGLTWEAERVRLVALLEANPAENDVIPESGTNPEACGSNFIHSRTPQQFEVVAEAREVALRNVTEGTIMSPLCGKEMEDQRVSQRPPSTPVGKNDAALNAVTSPLVAPLPAVEGSEGGDCHQGGCGAGALLTACMGPGEGKPEEKEEDSKRREMEGSGEYVPPAYYLSSLFPYG